MTDHSADANKMVDRHTLQAQGKHPAPCARFCEANAFRIEERQQARLIAELEAKVKALTLDAACWRWLSEHIQVAWSESGFTSLVRIVSDKHREMLTATVKRMMHGDWSDVHKRQQAQPQAKGEPPCSPS